MRKEKIIIFLIIIGGLFLRLINLNQSFWLDEAAQVMESARPFSQQLKISADFHPPLFHLLLHFWLYLGRSEVWIRILPVILGISSLFLFYQLSTILKGKFERILAVLFLAISPYHIWYSQEARPYMLFVFFSLLSTLMLLKRKWFWYALSILLSLYSLYFAPFLILGHLSYLLFIGKRVPKQFFLSILTAGLLFLPWFPFFARQIEVGTKGSFSGWSNVVSVMPLKAIPLTFAKFIFGKGSIDNLFIAGPIFFLVMILFAFGLLKINKEREGKAISLIFFVPFIFAILTSYFLPVVAPQRLIFLLPLFLLILSYGIINLDKPWRILSILFFCCISLFGLGDYYFNPYTQREQWRQAVAFVENNPEKNSLALFAFPEPFAPYLWYKKNTVEVLGFASKFKVNEEDLKMIYPRIEKKKKIYLFQYLTGLTDPEEKTRQFLETHDFFNSRIADFPGVGFIYLYDKK